MLIGSPVNRAALGFRMAMHNGGGVFKRPRQNMRLVFERNSSAESFSEKARKPLIALASLHHIVIETFIFSLTGTLRFKVLAFLSLLSTVWKGQIYSKCALFSVVVAENADSTFPATSLHWRTSFSLLSHHHYFPHHHSHHHSHHHLHRHHIHYHHFPSSP